MIATCYRAATQHSQLAITGWPDLLRFAPTLWALPVGFSWDPLLPYFTAVLLLAVGLSIAIKRAPPQANWLDKIILWSRIHRHADVCVRHRALLSSRFGRPNHPRLDCSPYLLGLFRGNVPHSGGVSIVVQKCAGLSAGLFGVMLLWFEVLMHIPRVVAAPHNRLVWALAFRDFSFSWGALSFAAMHAEEWKTKGLHWLITLARVFMGITVIFFAVQYFLHPRNSFPEFPSGS